MEEFWNDRYSQEEFAYGKEPNSYVKSKLPLFTTGKVLFPAEGEGRNAVYAAQLGWKVSAFDFSTEGKRKADLLAKQNAVTIDYKISGILEEDYLANEFDLICLTYVHFEPEVKKQMHARLNRYLKIGGYIVLEAFSKEHRELNKVNPAVGGPPSASLMYSIEEIERDFPNYEIIELKKEMVQLDEGFGHVGEGSVIRFLAKKLSE